MASETITTARFLRRKNKRERLGFETTLYIIGLVNGSVMLFFLHSLHTFVFSYINCNNNHSSCISSLFYPFCFLIKKIWKKLKKGFIIQYYPVIFGYKFCKVISEVVIRKLRNIAKICFSSICWNCMTEVLGRRRIFGYSSCQPKSDQLVVSY